MRNQVSIDVDVISKANKKIDFIPVELKNNKTPGNLISRCCWKHPEEVHKKVFLDIEGDW